MIRDWGQRVVLSGCRVVFKTLRYRGLSQYTPLLKLFHRIFRFALPKGEVFVSINNVSRLYLDREENTDMVRHLVLGGSYEPSTTRVFRRYVRKGMTVIDIGSHVGYYTTFAATLVGEGGKVLAFEPDPATYKLLCKNIEANGFRNVVPVQKAIAREIATRQLYLRPDGRTSRLHHTPGTQALNVDAVSLDQYLGTSAKVDFIKMDIEGAEAEALAGMEGIITHNPALTMVTEFCPFLMERAGFRPREFLRRLSDLGFKLYMIDERESEKEDKMLGTMNENISVPGERNFNILCVRNH